METNRPNQFALLIGRLMVGGMYLYSGITNLIELGGKAGYAASKGLPDAQLWVTLASLLLVVASVGVCEAGAFAPAGGEYECRRTTTLPRPRTAEPCGLTRTQYVPAEGARRCAT